MSRFGTVVVGAVVALASCRSALDVQVEGALARASAQESHRATTDQAEELARPVWWHGAPIAVPTVTSRSIGAWCVNTSALAFTPGASTVLVLCGPRGDVRLELEGGSFGSAEAIEAWLSAADTSARIGPAAGERMLLAVVSVGAPTNDGAFHIVSGGTSAVAASATAVVARCVWFDALCALPADGTSRGDESRGTLSADTPRSSYELALASDDARSRAASSAVLVRPNGDGLSAREFAARAGFALAIALADARATELDRHLIALDGEYSARVVGESGVHVVPTERLAWWHRDVRARLRALALGGDSANIALEPPR